MNKAWNLLRRVSVISWLCCFPTLAFSQPNVVLVLLDNFGWGEPGFNGGGIVRGAPTPRLDQLAKEGLRLTNFNVEVQCTPSRSAFMTGRYAIRSGTTKAPVGKGPYGLIGWEYTLAEMFSDSGYSTGMFGKWHLGRTPGRFPTDQGFDEWFGIPNSSDESIYATREGFAESGVSESYVMASTSGNLPEQVRPWSSEYRPLIDVELTRRALDFMSSQVARETPFFLYLPYTATHFPVMPHPDYAGVTGNGRWADLLHQIDQLTGKLLDHIERLGIADNTIFIFTADNGPEAAPIGNHSLSMDPAFHGSAGPWRSTLFTGGEGALRVPFVIRWPGSISAGQSSDEIVHAIDLFPTLATILNADIPSDRVIDGVDQTAFLLGQQTHSNREGFVVYMGDEIFGVKWRNWKIHLKEMATAFDAVQRYNFPRIYNLLSDPEERESRTLPDSWVAKAGLAQLDGHLKSLQDFPPIPTGTADPYLPPETKKD